MDGTKHKYTGPAALAVLAGVDTLLIAKGKKLESFDLAADRPPDEELLPKLLGPTGNLRAPTVRVGKTLVVGYNEEAYRRVFGT